MKRRVLLVGVSAQKYGSERSLLTTAAGLVRRGFEVQVLLPGEGELADDLRAAGARVRIGPVGTFRRSFGALAWVRWLLLELPRAAFTTARIARGVDVVHVNTSVTFGAAVGARLARRPLVWHVRESFEAAPRAWRIYGRVLRGLATRVVANSSATAAALGVPDAVVVHNGLELGPPPDGPPSGTGVVTVGRLAPGKGHDVLVDAVALLRGRGIDVRTTIAGDAFPGMEHVGDALRESITRQGVDDLVRLPGFVDDVPSMLDDHAIFVLPSRRPEGFGLALLEAMGRGLACVSTNIGGPLEIIDDGQNGLLVPPDDAPALADAIAALVEDPALRHRLGRAAATDARARFGADALVDRVVAVYDEVCP